MLKKLCYYDGKWIFANIAVFYVLALIFAGIARLFECFGSAFVFVLISKISTGVSLSMAISALFNSVIRCWVRLIVNVYKDEGYLTNTLPVRRENIFDAKVLMAVMGAVASILVIGVSVVLCFYSEKNVQAIRQLFSVVSDTLHYSPWSILLLFLLLLMIQAVMIILSGDIGIILGYRMIQRRFLASVAIGFIVYGLISGACLGIVAIVGLFSEDISQIFQSAGTVSFSTMKSVLILISIIYGLMDIVLYFVGRKCMAKGINLD